MDSLHFSFSSFLVYNYVLYYPTDLFWQEETAFEAMIDRKAFLAEGFLSEM
jgi:hypothetical protein